MQSTWRIRMIPKEMGKIILAVDPGTDQSAFVLWDSHAKEILNKGILKNIQMVAYIQQTEFNDLVIEMIASYGMPVGKEVFSTCVWIGRFYQASLYPCHLIYRKEVKMHLCGNMRAKDPNIRQALIDMLGKEATKGVSKDVWAALAVAITYSQTIIFDDVMQIAEEAGI
jgi:hypothetical protein